MSAVHHVIVGEERHGVAKLGRSLLPAGASVTHLPTIATTADAEAARSLLPPTAEAPAIHLHTNDALLGADPVAALAELSSGRALAVTLHDVPQPQEGEVRFCRRRAVYRELADSAGLVLVCSEHERASLRSTGSAARIEVVPHPIDARHPGRAPHTRPATVGIIGWIYPGKGHERALEAMRDVMPGGTLVALGAADPGHTQLVDELRSTADRCGVGLEVSGYLSDDELLAGAASVAVPVCAHRHVSASGSLGTWLTAGRVPIVTDGTYAREVAARNPGSLTIAGSLPAAIAGAIADPASTVLQADVDVTPTTAQAAAHQERLLTSWFAQ